MKHYAKKLLDGNKWNPLLKYPRNEPCYCGSNKKFKKCCLENTSLVIPDQDFESVAAAVNTVRDSKE